MVDVEPFITTIIIWSGVVGVFVQVVKMAFKKIPSEAVPLISFVFGVVVGMFGLKLPFVGAAMLGAVASGYYDLLTKTPKLLTK